MKKRTVAAAVFLAVAAAAFAWSADSAPAAPTGGIPAHYRAVSIPLSGERLAFIKKGDRVDVLVTFEAIMADEKKEKITATILQNVLVWNVLRSAKLNENGVIELIVNPNEGQYAALALHQGELDLSLRPEGEVEMHPMEMASFRKLFK